MSIPINSYRIPFRKITSFKNILHLDIDKNATTDDIISIVATAINAPRDKIMFTLDTALDFKGNAATQKNATDVDEKVREQFKCNIACFLYQHSTSMIIIKP